MAVTAQFLGVYRLEAVGGDADAKQISSQSRASASMAAQK